MEEVKHKGPHTKLLQSEGLVIKPIQQGPKSELFQCDVHSTDTVGNVIVSDPIFKAVEARPTERFLKKALASSEKVKPCLIVFNKDKQNLELEGTPFMEILKRDDPKKNEFIVVTKENAAEDVVGVIEYRVIRNRIQFKVRGSECALVIEGDSCKGYSVGCLVSCGSENKIHSNELMIYQQQVKPFGNIPDPGQKLDGYGSKPEGAIGKILRLKKIERESKKRDVFLGLPKAAYDEERSLLLAITLLTSFKFFA